MHWKNGPWAANGGYEYNLVLIAALLGLVDGGPEWAFGALALGAATSELTLELGRRTADKVTGGSPATPPVTAGDPVTAD